MFKYLFLYVLQNSDKFYLINKKNVRINALLVNYLILIVSLVKAIDRILLLALVLKVFMKIIHQLIVLVNNLK